MTQNIELL